MAYVVKADASQLTEEQVIQFVASQVRIFPIHIWANLKTL